MLFKLTKKFIRWAGANRFSFLSLSLLTLILLFPLMSDSRGELLAVGTASVMIFGCYAVQSTRRHLVVALSLAAIAMARYLVEAVSPSNMFGAPDNIAAIPFFLYVLVTILNHVRRPQKVDRELVAAGISVYLLVGHTWAQFYALVEKLQPGSLLHRGDSVDYGDFIYFSFVTLTTLGYGDIAPYAPASRALAMIEAITGVIFMSVFIGGLVGALVSENQKTGA